MENTQRPGTSIRLKVAAGIFFLLMISVALSILISVTNHRNNLIETKLADLVSTNNIMNEVVRNIMLSGEAPIAVSTMQGIKNLPGFEEIEIYRRSGVVAFSDYSTLVEVNRRLAGMTQFEQTPRTEKKTLMNGTFKEVIDTNTPRSIEEFETETIKYYFPILNYSECRQCHGSDHFVRGVAYYQLSLEQAFNQISEARNILILFFTATGIVIAAILIMFMQHLIIKPIISIGEIVSAVGEGNLDIKSTVSSSDEIGVLSRKINSMISGLKEKRDLELQNRVIEARNQENRKYLDNINEGLLLINQDRIISDQYSLFLTELFETGNIAGRDFVDFIYPDKVRYAEKRNELIQLIDMIFNKPNTEMEMIMSINPLSNTSLTVDKPDGEKEIIIDTDFERIFSNGKIENVMVIFTDKTDIVHVQQELEDEKKRSASEIEHIAAIIKNGPQAFLDFEQDALNTLAKVKNNLSGEPDIKTIQRLKRDIHSLKGSARYLEFRKLSSTADTLEEVIESSGWDQNKIKENIDIIDDELEKIHEINEKFKNFANTMNTADGNYSELNTFINNLNNMVTSIAQEMNKEIEVIINNDLDQFPQLASIKNSIIHLARNAVDHGIEDEIERVSTEKTENPTVKFRFYKDRNNYGVSIADNGRGIDFEAVWNKARTLGLINGKREEYSNKQLLQLLFTPDFSTREKASEISGRGAGLDVVHAEVQDAGGTISVTTTKGKGSRFTIKIPINGGKP
jgi:methyl-accepting chemotaxis protein